MIIYLPDNLSDEQSIISSISRMFVNGTESSSFSSGNGSSSNSSPTSHEAETPESFSMAPEVLTETETPAPDTTKGYELIDVMNLLQTKCAASGHKIDVSLPQIVAVGAQSSGKSSVLESIVGKEFLPRGTGVVTRRPIIIQLNQLYNSNESYAKFDHTEDKVFTDFNDVRKEIEEETDKSLEPGAFSSTPIILKIFSPKVLKLTIVDLPGIVKCAVDGQDATSVTKVREIILEYISKPESIILAVTANQDIATSDALQMAEEVDPQRERTIGVLTKLDLMDDGTNALDVLENRKYYLKKGYVGVVNRGQKDILEKRDMDYVLKKEKYFFEHHPAYSHIANRMGIPHLRKHLQKILRTHIKATLPKVRNDLSMKLINVERSLRTLEKNIGPKKNNFFLIKLVGNFIKDITICLMGNSELVRMDEVSAGAHIHFLLHNEIQKNLNLDLVPDGKELTLAVVNLTANRNSVSVPTLTIESICRKLLSSYKRPLELSVSRIMDVLQSAVQESSSLLNEYPTLKNEVLYRVRCCINRESDKTQERLSFHIDSEMYTINMCHPDFDGSTCDNLAPSAGIVKTWEPNYQKSKTPVDLAKGNIATTASATASSTTGTPTSEKKKNYANVISNDQSNAVSSTVDMNCTRTRNAVSGSVLSSNELVTLLMENTAIQNKVRFVSALIMEYLKIVKKNIGDIAIKYISYFLVKKVLDFINDDLISDLLDSTKFEKLMEDCEDDFQRKAEMEVQRDYIKKALDAIQTF